MMMMMMMIGSGDSSYKDLEERFHYSTLFYTFLIVECFGLNDDTSCGQSIFDMFEFHTMAVSSGVFLPWPEIKQVVLLR